MANIATIAGTGEPGYSGDGGRGIDAYLCNPFGLAIGPDGALYFCEVDNHCIRRLDLQSGVLTTFAGTGHAGYAGDGGPPLEARLNQPYEIRFDAAGAMYIVEMENHIVRRIDAATGLISTVAGTSTPGFAGDGGPATEAQLHRPHSIELDGQGGLFVADISNHRIRRVDLGSGVIETFAGTGEAAPTPNAAPLEGTPLNGPRALTFDAAGDMLVALREGNAVYRIDMQRRSFEHLAGTGSLGYTGDGGPATAADLSGPKGIAVAPSGDVYIADTESHTIRAIDRNGVITTVAGDGSKHDGPDGDPLSCGLARPHGIFIDSAGSVYVGDSENHRVRLLY